MRKLGAPLAVLALTVSSLAAALPATASPTHPTTAGSTSPGAKVPVVQKRVPALRVKTLARGLDVPWDVRPIGGGQLLFTQRDSATLTLIDQDADLHKVGFPSSKVW